MKLTTPERSRGSYRRDHLRQVRGLYNFLRHKQLHILFPTDSGRATKVTDTLAQELLELGLVDSVQYDTYLQRLCGAFPTVASLEKWDESYVEDIYAFAKDVRRQIFGADALDQLHILRAEKSLVFDPAGSIDQRRKKEELLAGCDCVLLALTDTAYFSLFAEDLAAIPHDNIWVLVSEDIGNDLPGQAVMETLLKDSRPVRYLTAGPELALPSDKACLLAYGEDALLGCRGLQLDCIVSAIPKGYYAQALVNQLGIKRACVVYVPGGMDITGCVSLTDRSSLTYWQLYRLWKDQGDGIYPLSPEQLRQRYPQYFLNIYDNRPEARDTQADFPVRIPENTDFEQARQQAISRYIEGFSGSSYGSLSQNGILVHHGKFRSTGAARVITCGGNIRAAAAELRPGLVSNFFFFLTDKLGILYNDLRADRPCEQARDHTGHLDYMLCRDRGIETFPLFHKMCIGQKEDGSFLFFRFRLGGGRVEIADTCIAWTADNVDREVTAPVQVFTPYFSVADENEPPRSYRKYVGQGRLNIVILQDKINCIRKGDVLLPGVGVVISLEEDHPLAAKLQPLEDGYYNTENLPLTVSLEPPDGFSRRQWEQIRWAYGGGMSLICDGVGICDDGQTEAYFRQEGWLSPLSWQTQESALHTMAKHPRTAFGITGDGCFVMLVFSGRSRYSAGADYREMIDIARKIYPDIRHLINADGGGSSVMGLVTQGSFLELNVPASSPNSTVGMVRPVYTALYIPFEQEKEI